ncbi:host specificity factor TipJ family phage tail protein [Zhongshania guokunii]|uniref:Host specificity factor TipJ family phage tail protein n=1 Tax=Zhongshania guokunii TaxID=641783 RepID=A0ABV3U6F1_9GAMM
MAQLIIYDQLGNSLGRRSVVGETLKSWLQSNVPSYVDLPAPPYSAELNSQPWPYAEHGVYVLQDGDVVALTIRARYAALPYIYYGFIALAVGYSLYVVSNLEGYQDNTPAGASSYNLSVRANRARVNGIIPHIAGSFPRFPDLLSGIRRAFVDGKEVLYLMYSLGVGRYNTVAEHVYISETPISQYSDDAVLGFYAPNADLSADDAAQNWFTSKEIGGSRGTAGLDLKYPAEDPAYLYDFVDAEIFQTEEGAASSADFDVDDVIYAGSGPEAVIGYYLITAIDPSIPYGITVERLLSSSPSDIDPDWVGFGSEGYFDVDASIALVPSVDAGPWSNWYQMAPEGEAVYAVEVDYEYPRGLWGVSGSGSKITTLSMYWDFELEHDSGTISELIVTTAKDQSPLRYTYRDDFGSPVYNPKIRFRRRNREIDRNIGQDLTIVRVKSRLEQNDSYADVTAMTLRLVGTDTLAASGENQINIRGDSRMLPTLANLKDHIENDAALAYSATSSISRFVAWTLYEMIGDDALTAVDWDRFGELETLWAGRGDELNGEFTDETTLWEALKIMLAPGFAEPIPREGKVTAIRVAAGDDFKHMYTPDVMMNEGLVWNEGWYNDAEPDGIDVEYVEPDTGKPAVIECRLPGDLGLNPKRLQIIGVTAATQAWRIGMRERRRLYYKPATLNFETELDALNSLPGDAIAIASDLDAEQYGVVRGFDGIDTVTTERPLEFGSGTYYAAFRKNTGRMSDLFEVEAGATAYDMVLLEPSNLDFDFELDRSKEPTLFSLGEENEWGTRAIVREINPNGFADGKPRVAVVAEEYIAEIYADDDNTPPEIS